MVAREGLAEEELVLQRLRSINHDPSNIITNASLAVPRAVPEYTMKRENRLRA